MVRNNMCNLISRVAHCKSRSHESFLKGIQPLFFLKGNHHESNWTVGVRRSKFWAWACCWSVRSVWKCLIWFDTGKTTGSFLGSQNFFTPSWTSSLTLVPFTTLCWIFHKKTVKLPVKDNLTRTDPTTLSLISLLCSTLPPGAPPQEAEPRGGKGH